MARQATGRLEVRCVIEEVETALGAGQGQSRLEHPIEFLKTLSSGTADGSVDRVYSATASLTATPTDIDVLGSLTSVLSGGATSFVDLAGIVIEHVSGTGVVQIGGDAAAVLIFGAVGDFINLYPGGVFCWYAPAGFAPTGTTGDILQLATASSTAVVRVILIGRSA